MDEGGEQAAPAGAAVAGKGRVRLSMQVRRADGSTETHEAPAEQLELPPHVQQVVQQITANKQAQLALGIACGMEPGVLVALRRAIGS